MRLDGASRPGRRSPVADPAGDAGPWTQPCSRPRSTATPEPVEHHTGWKRRIADSHLGGVGVDAARRRGSTRLRESSAWITGITSAAVPGPCGHARATRQISPEGQGGSPSGAGGWVLGGLGGVGGELGEHPVAEHRQGVPTTWRLSPTSVARDVPNRRTGRPGSGGCPPRRAPLRPRISQAGADPAPARPGWKAGSRRSCRSTAGSRSPRPRCVRWWRSRMTRTWSNPMRPDVGPVQVGARSEQASDLDPAARLLGREAQGSGGPGLGRVAVAAIGALACVDLTVDPCRRRVEARRADSRATARSRGHRR